MTFLIYSAITLQLSLAEIMNGRGLLNCSTRLAVSRKPGQCFSESSIKIRLSDIILKNTSTIYINSDQMKTIKCFHEF